MGTAANRTTLFRSRPAKRLALGMACAIALAIPAAQSGAQSIDELNSQIASAQDQASALGASIDARTAELSAAQAQAEAAAQREAQLSAVLARGQEREAELAAQVEQTQAELDAARARLQRALDALADRLVAIYKGGEQDATAVLLDAEGFDDLATRAELLGRIEEADSSLVARVRALRDDVAAKLDAVEEAKARAAAFNRQVAAARSQIATVRANAESEAAALAAARSRQQAALESLQARVSDWTAQVQRLEQISAQQAQEEVASWFGDWAIPQAIVMCESGGNFGAVNPSSGAGGAYQILPSTWKLYGGGGLPQNAPPGEQSRIAAQIWADSGSAAWVCAG